MKLKKTIKYFIRGAEIAEKHNLCREESWTPLLVYIHVTRVIAGFLLGTVFGIGLTNLFLLFFS